MTKKVLGWLKSRGMGRGGRLAIVERLVLTPQHTLCLVRVGEETLLIGTSPTRLELIRSAGTRACRVHTRVDTFDCEPQADGCPHECGHGRHECPRYGIEAK